MKLFPSSIVKLNELAGPKMRVSSNCETDVSIGPPNCKAVMPVPLGPGITHRWPWMWNVCAIVPIPTTPNFIFVVGPPSTVGVLPRYFRPFTHMPTFANSWYSCRYSACVGGVR